MATLTIHDPPGVLATPHPLPRHLQHGVAAHHSEGDARLQLPVLLLEFIVFVAVAFWELVDLEIL